MDAFTGEIRAFGFPFAPYDWALCDGQTMNIQQFTPLFAVIGNVFGGDGQTKFNLPNLQGRAAMDVGTATSQTSARVIGEQDGAAMITLGVSELPLHSHNVNVVTSNASGDAADKADPAGAYWANGIKGGRPPTLSAYLAPGAVKTPTAMAAGTIQASGSSASHTNMQPCQVLNMCICLNGYFPVRP